MTTESPTPCALAVAYLPMARRFAARRARRYPHLREEFESAACLELWRSARRFDPGRGVQFGTYLYRCLAGVISNVLRDSRPKGFRRRGRDVTPPEFSSDVEGLFSSSPPVGWELDEADWFDAILALLPVAQRRAVWLTFVCASCEGSRVRVGAAMGLSSGAAWHLVRDALEFLKVKVAEKGMSRPTLD